MAPLTRSSSTRAPMAPLTRRSSTRVTQRGGPLQAKAKSEPQVLWFGEANADQDIRIRLVANKGDDDHTLGLLMVHSSRLEKYSNYFSALLSPRWGSKRKRSPEEITLHVIGSIELYTDCFSRMHNPLQVEFESVRYSLELLPVATHLAYDDLMSSICLYLVATCPWTWHEEMRIRKAVLSEAFPRGHAKDLLERLEWCVPGKLRSLVTRSMKSLHLNLIVPWHREGRELLRYVLETAGKQEQGPIPTFEQEVATILNEEFKLLLVETNDEAEKKVVAGNETTCVVWGNMEGDRGFFSKLKTIQQVLQIMLKTGTTVTAVEGVKSFAKCRSFAKLIVREILGNESEFVRSLMDSLASTVVTILEEVLNGNFRLGDSEPDELFLNWVLKLEWLYTTASNRTRSFRLKYPRVRERLLSTFFSVNIISQVLKQIVEELK